MAASGDRGLDTLITNALRKTEHIADNIKGMDAELNALAEIRAKGWNPIAGASSRPVCPWCQNRLFDEGARLVGPFKNMNILDIFRKTPSGDRLTGQWQFIW